MPQSISSQQFRSAVVETGRIVNVNIKDWTVDVVSEHGSKKYFDIQVSSPYFHPMNGEGIYVMPEVGALVWVCKPSEGTFSAPFVLGFQAIHDQGENNFRNNRMMLNPGDIMMKTRDENFIILRRGGVLQIGATPIAQRMYLPIRNIIRDFCENYELHSLAGDMTWSVERDDKTTTGDALTTMAIKVKSKADDKAYIANVSLGSHGEGEATTLLLEIKESGDEGAATKVSVAMTKEGDVTWDVRRNLSTTVGGDNSLTVSGNHTENVSGNSTSQCNKDMTLDATLNFKAKAGVSATVEATADVNVKAGANANVDGVKVNLGGPAATEPIIKGTQLVTFLTNMLTQISTFSVPSAAVVAAAPSGAPVPVVAAPALASLVAQLPTLLSTKSFTS
jgi:hypothetical protein